MLRALLLAAAAGVLAALFAVVFFQHWRDAPLTIDQSGVLIVIEDGDSLGRVSRGLEKRGVIRHRRLFNLLGRLTGADGRIASGEYRIRPGSSPEAVLAQLQRGDTVRYLVTLPEGLRLADAIVLLGRADGVEPVLRGADDPRLQELVAPAASTEGYFLPETYQYERGTTDLELLEEAHRLMEDSLRSAWAERRPELPLADPYEALILASIIEKETGQADERAQIGGVFTRRLQRGMRLQTDPTVIYGLGESFDGNLTREHLRDESNLYNSYRHHGLPPGPIALPGRAALMAAVQPEAGDSLYFVARGDGSHAFSATLEEHQAAVARFQLRRRSDYRSSPAARP